MSTAIIIMAADPVDRIEKSSADCGRLAIGYGSITDIFRVIGISESMGEISVGVGLQHVRVNIRGVWCRATPELHAIYTWFTRIGQPLDRALFSDQLSIEPALINDEETLFVTHSPGATPVWAAWLLSGRHAIPVDVEVLHPSNADPLPLLEPGWPLGDLTGEVAIVGAGSIGSAAALALAMYGVRKITLVDDDRLRWHNLVRHQATHHAVGQYKVEAVSEAIRSRWPATAVEALRHNVISDADLMRPLFRRCALILCAADGVAPRRVVSHLTRRAGKTAILGCVLLDGAFGEIIRLRPWPGHGCLLCQRAYLAANGAMDPEHTLDSDYGTGTAHRPMTAVGSDLALVGQYAAKVAVATLLEYSGHYDQRIELDWAVIGLRGDLRAPALFRLSPGEVRWLPHVASRPNCPTCGTT